MLDAVEDEVGLLPQPLLPLRARALGELLLQEADEVGVVGADPLEALEARVVADGGV